MPFQKGHKGIEKKPRLEKEKLSIIVKAAQERFITACEILNHKYKTVWFHEHIANTLQRALEEVMAGGKVRIILALPPRHGKSEEASVLFPAWALGKYPELQFILSTYGADLSEKMGLKTRDVINSAAYKLLFPDIEIRKDVKAKAKWMTNKGGSYTGVGIGTAVTGTGGNFILLDDPHKDRAEAESLTVRDSVWQYFQSTLYSRLEGSGGIVVIMQRWHVDDLIGRLHEEKEKLKAAGLPYDDWEVINFPAIAEADEYISLPTVTGTNEPTLVRKEGEALWPVKFGLEVLENIKAKDLMNWTSQYQQNPILAENQEFKQKMFKYYDIEDLKDKYLRYYTLVDPAISKKKRADNTVVLTIAKEVNGPNIYRMREDAGKFTPNQTIDLIFKHYEDYHSEVYIETVAYQEALKFFTEEEQIKRQLYFTVNEIKPRSNKEERIRGLLPMYGVGVIYHLRSDTDYEVELLQFPLGKRDDRPDAMAMGIGVLDNTRSSNKAKRFVPNWLGHRRVPKKLST